MSHIAVTQSRPIPMPRQSYLLERNRRFYLNMRVPKDLRPAYGKVEFIRKSLGTSERLEAISRVRFEAFKLDSEFEEKRRELKAAESPPCRLLREVFGEKTPVASIGKEKVEQLFDLLRKAPSNVTKRYRGLSLEQAIKVADKNGDEHRLSAKSLENYYANIIAIFNFAVEEGWLPKNPAKGRLLRASFEGAEPAKPKALFTIAELNQLFRAPLFMPAREVLIGGRKSKSKILEKGHAWLPLLSLFHGFRCNEVAQLFTEDVKTEEGVPFIEIREDREDGSKSEKRLKTKQSKRRVPIHPEVLKIGFRGARPQEAQESANLRIQKPRVESADYKIESRDPVAPKKAFQTFLNWGFRADLMVEGPATAKIPPPDRNRPKNIHPLS